MSRWISIGLSFTALTFWGHHLLATVIDIDTVNDRECSLERKYCGEMLIVVDGDGSPTTLNIIEPTSMRFSYGGGDFSFDWLNGERAVSSPAIAATDTSVVNFHGGSLSMVAGGPILLATERSTVNVSGGFVSS